MTQLHHPNPPKRWVILPAGGIGERMGLPYPKQLVPYRGQPLASHVVAKFAGEHIVVAIPPQHRDTFEAVLGTRAQLVDGGATRYASVRNAFEALNPAAEDLICIHDMVRPFFDPATLPGAWAMAADKGSAVYAHVATDTLKQVDDQGCIVTTLDRNRVYHAQTPQIFKADLLRQAYALADQTPDAPPTDEAALLERAELPVHIWPSSVNNRKLTHREDLSLLENVQMRIGHGYDVHRFDPNRPLFLGGVLLPEGPGLLGHSDADVVIHALIDALLGAAGLGDIGTLFPDTDATYAGIRSTLLLARVWEDLQARGWRLVNADITVQAQIPKLAPHIPAMRTALSELLSGGDVNVKATTTEKLGFVGQKEGMACHAVVLLNKVTP